MDAGFMLAGELARQVGVSTDTLRHYERKGVLPRPHRSSNGYRMYPPSAPDRVRLVRRALAVGFTLDELAVILAERDRGGAPCRSVYDLANAKLRYLETRIHELAVLRDDLRSLLKDWKKRLNGSGDGHHRLLESLTDRSVPSSSPLNLKKRTK